MIGKLRGFITASVISRLVCAIFLFLALGNLPYGFYVLLRWVTLLACGYSLIVAKSKNDTKWAWAFAVIGLLFNPIIPVHMDKSTWAIVDAITAILMIVSVFFIREKEIQQKNYD